jgi:hypothetical protein
MGIIVRTPYVAGNDITAEGQNDNEDLYVNEFNGNIDNANIKLGADIEGIKLADTPNGVPTAKINDNAVTTAKIADDAVDANKLKDDAITDANRAVTTNHIRDLAVTAAKIADGIITAAKLAIDSVIAVKLKTTTFNYVPGAVGGPVNTNTGLGSTIKPLTAYAEKAFVAIGASDATIMVTIWWSTTTNTWWLNAYRTDGTPTNFSGITIKLLYVMAA